jgi:hypothetical protein
MSRSKDLMTPEELHAHIAGLMSSQEPVAFFSSDKEPLGKILTYHGASTIARGSCLKVAGLVHPYLPAGSKIVQIANEDMGSEHYLHHVPTTEGPYAVDFTHSQFEPNGRSGPVVEALSDYNQRKAAQARTDLRSLTEDQQTRASSTFGVHHADVELHRDIQS